MAVFALGIVSVTGLVRYGVVRLSQLGVGVVSGAGADWGGHWAGGKVFGEGSDGQKVTALASGVIIGGLTAWRGSAWLRGAGTWLRGAGTRLRSAGRWLNARRLPTQDRLNNAKAVKDLEAGILPGTAKAPGQPRNMPPSKDPNKTAEDFAVRLFGSEKINKQPLRSDCVGCWKARRDDGTWISYRPAGRASHRTPQDMASVGVSNNLKIDAVNIDTSGKIKPLKLKFPSI